MLNSLLSMERLAKIKKSVLFDYAYYPVIIDLIISTILSVGCASINLFNTSSAKISCLLNVTNSILASVTYHYSLLSCFIAVGLLVYSYYCIAAEISGFEEIMSAELEANSETSNRKWSTSLKKASLKVYLILTIYGTCMLGSLISLFLETTLKYKYGDTFEYSEYLIYTATLLFILGMIFNALLILALHSGIANEVKCFIQIVHNK